MSKRAFRAIIKYPRKEFMETNIQDDLAVLQGEVGGHIEVVGLGNGLLMLVNEECKNLSLEANFRLGDDIIVGAAIFCGQKGENFGDVPVTIEGLTQLLEAMA